MPQDIENSVQKRRLQKVVEDIAGIKQTIMTVATAVNGQFIQVDETMTRFGAILDALTVVVGADKVQEALDAKASDAARIQALEAKEQLQAALDAGAVKVADIISAESIVVGVQKDAQGETMEPGYVQFSIAQGAGEAPYLAGLVGKKVGDVLATPVNTTIEVKAIFDVAPKDAPPVTLTVTPGAAEVEAAAAAVTTPAAEG